MKWNRPLLLLIMSLGIIGLITTSAYSASKAKQSTDKEKRIVNLKNMLEEAGSVENFGYHLVVSSKPLEPAKYFIVVSSKPLETAKYSLVVSSKPEKSTKIR